MSKNTSLATGLKFGLIAAVLYAACVFLKFRFFDGRLSAFSLAAISTYILFVGLWIVAALSRRKQLGGYIEIKDLFQTIFIVIILGEIACAAVTYIYPNMIDPSFFDRLAETTRQSMQDKGGDAAALEELVTRVRDQKNATLGTAGLALAQSIVTDSILGIIIAFLIKRTRMFSERDLDAR